MMIPQKYNSTKRSLRFQNTAAEVANEVRNLLEQWTMRLS